MLTLKAPFPSHLPSNQTQNPSLNHSSHRRLISLQNSLSINVLSKPTKKDSIIITEHEPLESSPSPCHNPLKKTSSLSLAPQEIYELSNADFSSITPCKNPCRSVVIPEIISQAEDLPKEVADTLKQLRNEAQRKFKVARLFVLGNLLANILGFLTFYKITDLLTLLIIILAFMFLILIYSIWKKTSEQSKYAKLFWVAHLISLGIFLTMAVLRVEQIINIMTFGVIPGFVVLFSQLFLNQTRLVMLVAKFVIWVQLLLIGLEVDELIKLPWCITIIILNSIAVICLICIILIMMLWISTLLGGSYSSARGKTAVIGSTWHLLLILSTLTWTIDVISFENLIGIPISTNQLWYIFIAGAAYCVVLLGFTVIYNKGILTFLKEQAYNELKDSDKVIELEYKTVFQLQEPKEVYLIRLSSSYYGLPGAYGIKGSQDEGFKKNQSRYIQHAGAKKEVKPCLNDVKIGYMEIPQKVKGEKRSSKSMVGELFELNKERKIERKQSFDVKDNEKNKAERLKLLKRRNVEEEGKRNCMICFANDADAVVMDCSHGSICCECAVKSWKTNETCHICRGNVGYLVRVRYLPELDVYKVMNRIVKKKEKRDIVF